MAHYINDIVTLEETYYGIYETTSSDINTEVQALEDQVNKISDSFKTRNLNDPISLNSLQQSLAFLTTEFSTLYNYTVKTQDGDGEDQERMILALEYIHVKLGELASWIKASEYSESVNANELLLSIQEATNYMSSNLKLLL